MTKSFTLLMVACSAYFIACGDSSSDPDNLTFVNDDGEDVSVDVSTGSFKDPRDGKSYKTITIGEQTWMTENLAYIGEGTNSSDKKYSWASAQEACPEGWHLSLESEWQELFKTIEKAYGDSAGWALKSKSGWANDSTNGEVSSGNGGNILGFDIEPTGICRGGDCRYNGSMAGFWTMSKKDRDGYANYIRFETDPDSHSGEIYQDARLHVRCVSDKNTLFESLGKCTSEKEDSIGEYDSTYYKCSEKIWIKASLNEALNYKFGACGSTQEGKVYELNDSAVICKASSYGDTYSWSAATMDEALGECSDKNVKEIKKYNGQKYACHMLTSSWYSWEEAGANDLLPECKQSIEFKIDYFNDTAYICKEGFSSYTWQIATEEEEAKGKLGECTSAMQNKVEKTKAGDFACVDNSWKKMNQVEQELGLCSEDKKGSQKTTSNGTFLCMGKAWRPLNIVEQKLGVCLVDGATGEFEGFTFTCDASKMRWSAYLGEDGLEQTINIVAFDSVLWTDMRYFEGDCPSGFYPASRSVWESIIQALTERDQLDELYLDRDSSYYGLNVFSGVQLEFFSLGEELTNCRMETVDGYSCLAGKGCDHNYREVEVCNQAAITLSRVDPDNKTYKFENLVKCKGWIPTGSSKCTEKPRSDKCIKNYGKSDDAKSEDSE